MKYYIEVKKGGEVLKEHSRVCGEEQLKSVIEELYAAVKYKADIIRIYTYEEIHNSDTIKHYFDSQIPEV